MKSEWFNMRVTKEEKRELEVLSKQEDRTISNFILWLVGQFKNRRK